VILNPAPHSFAEHKYPRTAGKEYSILKNRVVGYQMLIAWTCISVSVWNQSFIVKCWTTEDVLKPCYNCETAGRLV